MLKTGCAWTAQLTTVPPAPHQPRCVDHRTGAVNQQPISGDREVGPEPMNHTHTIGDRNKLGDTSRLGEGPGAGEIESLGHEARRPDEQPGGRGGKTLRTG